jgi:hypothetical protein
VFEPQVVHFPIEFVMPLTVYDFTMRDCACGRRGTIGAKRGTNRGLAALLLAFHGCMRFRTRVYVVSTDRARSAAIAGALRAGRDPPAVYRLGALPSVREIVWRSVIVVDLRNGPDAVASALQTVELGAPSWVLIAESTQAVPASWLAVAHERNVQLLYISPTDALDEPQLRAAVTAAQDQNLERLVAGVSQRCGGLFWGLDDLVRALVRDPWGIRRPHHLASALGISASKLRRMCAPLRQCRLEHVVTLVRWCAYEFLTLDCHVSPARALEPVGVKDRSNFRRQVRRVKAGPDLGGR